MIPNLDVLRPADPEETAGAFAAAMQRTEGPTALILTRQVVPNLSFAPVETRREGVLKGAYILVKETAPFVGAAASVVLLGDPVTPPFVAAAALMAAGVAALLTEPYLTRPE